MSYILEHKTDIIDAAWSSGVYAIATVSSSLTDDCEYPVLFVRADDKAFASFQYYLNEFVSGNKFLVYPATEDIIKNNIMLTLASNWIYEG